MSGLLLSNGKFNGITVIAKKRLITNNIRSLSGGDINIEGDLKINGNSTVLSGDITLGKDPTSNIKINGNVINLAGPLEEFLIVEVNGNLRKIPLHLIGAGDDDDERDSNPGTDDDERDDPRGRD